MADLLSSPAPADRLRSLIEAGDGPLLLPGCYDALGARLIEQAGFDGVYMTGFGTAASLLGRPDVGLLGLAEMIDNARRIAAAVAVPVVADADTGYGNPVNVVHTVRSYERAGVAAIHLEDQVMPKRCGHMEGKEVVPVAEFAAKIRAAVDARSTSDFLIIARTDARAPLGLDEARRRADAAAEAGADVLFIEALRTRDEIEAIAAEYRDTPLLYNWVEGGKSPSLPYSELAELGFSLVIMPITVLLAAVGAMRSALDGVKAAGTPIDVEDNLPSFGDFTDLIGLSEITELQGRYI
ncbi:MAG: oxaloacetate decarboxylase [Acidimicrobiia bacterium]|nr:oxaloacetate decarboxylase [Acidimicrobiia bacterium]